jgi:hypothetical protein
MPEILADPLPPSCYDLFPGPGIQESQQLAPDPISPRARAARGRFAKGGSGNPRGGRGASPIPSGGCPTSPPGR